jgi:hypothetical protein
MAYVAVTDCRIEEGSSSEDLDEMKAPQPHFRFARTLGVFVSVAGLLACAYTWCLQDRSSQQSQVVKSEVTLFAPFALAASVAEGLATSSSGLWKNQGIAALAKVRRNIRNSKPADLKQFTNLTSEDLIPEELTHDGNVCADDEEEHGGLCYKKCHSLTDGVYPLRTTAWSCCKNRPCTFLNSKFTNPLSPCEGYDVSGSRENQACPHAPGTCLVNEEFNLGMCFKRCAILTDNAFPYRSAASTCCKYNSHWACLYPRYTKTSSAFDVGGGAADGDEATPNSMHPPIKSLTED